MQFRPKFDVIFAGFNVLRARSAASGRRPELVQQIGLEEQASGALYDAPDPRLADFVGLWAVQGGGRKDQLQLPTRHL
eukprot:2877375-Heterocapsa_arctica.AAC.1